MMNKNIKNYVKIIKVKSFGFKIDKGCSINYEKMKQLIIFGKRFGLSLIEMRKFPDAL